MLFRHLVGHLGQVNSPTQGLYRHRKMWTDIHVLSGIRIHDPSVRAIETHAPDCTATVTGSVLLYFFYRFLLLLWKFFLIPDRIGKVVDIRT
jgi:hypothetical protein